MKPEQGGWVIRINPEAGDTKTNDYRDVPVHDHLIAVGFIEFLQQVKARPPVLRSRQGRHNGRTG